jgi:hypothetical protein
MEGRKEGMKEGRKEGRKKEETLFLRNEFSRVGLGLI